jgi:anthranilate phosphoribosyltransferase
VRDAVLLNAGAALAVVSGSADSVDDQLTRGIARATEAIDSGAAAAKLDAWVAASAAS